MHAYSFSMQTNGAQRKFSLSSMAAGIAGAVVGIAARLSGGKSAGSARSTPEEGDAPCTAVQARQERFLLRRVPQYRCLDGSGRELFRRRVAAFLGRISFHGAGVAVTPALRLLAASSAVVPTLGLPDWEYTRLREIIFRPDGYEYGEYQDDDGVVTEYAESGMVGTSGILSGTMMLSSEDLVWEFAHPEDGGNVGFHEFAHLMMDEGLSLAEADREGWAGFLRAERARIRRGASLLDEYALLNEDEFFAVSSELFFCVPRVLRQRHRKLYAVLARCYRQDPAKWRMG